MSLNHKRRIFRSTGASLPSLGGRLPSLGVMLAAAGGAGTLLLVAALFVGPSEAPAHAPAGKLSAGPEGLAVLDGNTISLGQQLVRLEGIVAPPRGSLCHSADQGDLDCGSAAANALASLIRRDAVDCTIHGHDGQGRPLGNCVAAGKPLNEAMVRDGWARAASAGLHDQETSARAAGRGIWRDGSH